MGKCIYCSQDTTEKIPLDIASGTKDQYCCSDVCKEEILKYTNDVESHKWWFLGLMLGSVFIMVMANGVISALNLNPRYTLVTTCVAVAIIGLAVIRFPFVTPQTVQLFGIKKSKIIARFLGLFLIVFGIVMTIFC